MSSFHLAEPCAHATLARVSNENQGAYTGPAARIYKETRDRKTTSPFPGYITGYFRLNPKGDMARAGAETRT